MPTGEEFFPDLFCYAAGNVEAPACYFRWTALSLVAACIDRRVYFEKMTYQRIYPNLYLFLIGGSASGKGLAIGMAEKLVDLMDACEMGAPNIYRGKLTSAAMHDEMAVMESTFETSAPVYLITPEVSNAVGTGSLAKDLIKFTTEIWEGTPKYTETTRTSGKHVIRYPCLNWIAGSTPQWCSETVDYSDLMSGFFARVMAVIGERDDSIRIPFPDTSGWDQVKQWLAYRLALLLPASDKQFEGAMFLTEAAKSCYADWYCTRSATTVEYMEPTWKRLPDQVLKLAMLMKLCQYHELDHNPAAGDWRYIGEHEISQSVEMIEGLQPDVEAFIKRGLMQHYAQGMSEVQYLIKRFGKTSRSKLVSRCLTYGIRSKDLDEIVISLSQEGIIEATWDGTKNEYMYKWLGSPEH